MPELCRFYNIIIKMIYSDSGQHNKPHFHVYSAEYEVSVGVDGELLAGSLPVKQLKLVLAWAVIHEDELYAAWNSAVKNEPFGKIESFKIEGASMYIINEIAYAGEPAPVIKVNGIRPMDGYRLWVRFSTGEAKIFDLKPLLGTPAFSPLSDKTVFNSVYIDYGVPVWNDGDIDLSPERLYKDGISVGINLST